MELTEKDIAIIMARNALLRAWRGSGLPLAIGGAGLFGQGIDNPGRWVANQGYSSVILFLQCEACGATTATVSYWPVKEINLREAQVRAVDRLKRLRNCEHLLPLALTPSPEVMAIAELELLAG